MRKTHLGRLHDDVALRVVTVVGKGGNKGLCYCWIGVEQSAIQVPNKISDQQFIGLGRFQDGKRFHDNWFDFTFFQQFERDGRSEDWKVGRVGGLSYEAAWNTRICMV